MPSWPEALADLRVVVRIAVAAFLVAPLGWERERKDRPAGLRTHILVGVSAALLVSIARPLVDAVGGDSRSLQYDPLRVLEAVMAGIAFLGAGTIVVRRDEGAVQGLTTAGSLLAAATIGLTVGIERWVMAAGASAVVVTVLAGLGWLQRRVSE